MFSKFGTLSVALLLVVLGLVSCGDPEEALRQKQMAERSTEWTAVQADRQALMNLRSELEALVAEGPEAAEEEIRAKRNAVEAASDDFTNRLITFINDGVDKELEQNETHQQAIRMKSDEDILVAQEFIEKGGDYGRAIEIYENAMRFDPEYAALTDALNAAQADRYITEEKFELAKKGMTEEEIRANLGPVFHHNVQEYPDKNVLAWFYPKANDGSAAAVYFRRKGEEPYKVYQLKFDAVDARDEAGG